MAGQERFSPQQEDPVRIDVLNELVLKGVFPREVAEQIREEDRQEALQNISLQGNEVSKGKKHVARGLIRFATRFVDSREERRNQKAQEKEAETKAKEKILMVATELAYDSKATSDYDSGTRTFTGFHETAEGPQKVKVFERKDGLNRTITVVGSEGFRVSSRRRVIKDKETGIYSEKGKIRVHGMESEEVERILYETRSASGTETFHSIP